jgi:Ca-activated chloride channel family protein
VKFALPEAFYLLGILPVLVYVHFWRENQRVTDFRFPSLILLAGTPRSWRVWMRHLPFVLRCAALALMIVVLARPQVFDKEISRKVEGIDIILCLDTSTSMLAEDLKPNRVEAAKTVAQDFVRGRVSDRIGVVPFAAESWTQCPLTTDYEIVTGLLGDLKTGMVEDGTAIGMAMATSLNRLRESQAKSKVIILLTDGQNNRGEIDPVTAAQAATALDIKIYTVAVGTQGMAPYPVETVFGKRYQQVPVTIDEEMMKQIATLTGGQYFRATDEKKLARIYEEIDRLEKTEVNVEEYRRVAEVFHPWLWAALGCISLEFLLSLWGLRKLP